MARESFFHALWKQSKVWPLVAGVLLLLNLLAGFIVGRILAPEVEEAKMALAGEQERRRQQVAGSLPSGSGTAHREAGRELEEFRQILLSKDELTLFLGEIYHLAGDAGLQIDRITFKPETVEEHGMLRYTLSFSISGAYPQVKKFVRGFEDSERIMILDKLSLSGKQARSDRVGLNLQLTTYFRSGNR